MTLSFPMSAADFADRLRVSQVKWRLVDFIEASGTAMGQVITAEIAPPKWRAEVTLATASNAEAAGIAALIEAIGPHERFYLHNPTRRYPLDDPSGARLGGASPGIFAVASNNRALRLDGLPAGYRLSPGDMLAFDYGSAPVRRALHRVVEGAVANSAGVTPAFEIRPHVKAGTVEGIKVTLVGAAARMIFEPGTFDPGTAGPLNTTGMAFTAIEAR